MRAALHPHALICPKFRTRTGKVARAPRSTAMAMVGRKTKSIYRRYAMIDEQMHCEAAATLDQRNVEQKVKADAERKAQVKRFKKRQTA